VGVLVCLRTGNAFADEVFLTEAQAPVALFGAGAVGQRRDVVLTDAELGALSRLVQKRVEQRNYVVLDVRGPAGAPLGAIVILDVIGQSLPIQFAVGVKPDGSLQDMQVMVYREPYGKEINERRFRAQFRGKTARDPLVVGKDIDAISGASISSQSAAYAVRKALAVAGIVAGRK
jgi:Na+-translocating ferredoxin:NAD+ oxidoreductase RnfG subunit